MRIIQISDTHLSRDHHQFDCNTAAILHWVKGQDKDLIISTGDVTMNGAIGDYDYRKANDYHVMLRGEVLAVPGNHDIGDGPDLREDQVLNNDRLKRFDALIGPDRWIKDIAGWRLIGLNAMLCGTHHARETEQEAWFEEALNTSAKVALFLHKPLFLEHPHEGHGGYWSIRPEPRARLMAMMAKADVRLVSSGHLHIYREQKIGNTTYLWCPASSFICGACQEDLGGMRAIGVIDHHFTAEGHHCKFVQPEGVKPLLIDDHLSSIYPAPDMMAAQ